MSSCRENFPTYVHIKSLDFYVMHEQTGTKIPGMRNTENHIEGYSRIAVSQHGCQCECLMLLKAKGIEGLLQLLRDPGIILRIELEFELVTDKYVKTYEKCRSFLKLHQYKQVEYGFVLEKMIFEEAI